jgi:isoquinoline 1-oxidoreductase alpha subunit
MIKLNVNGKNYAVDVEEDVPLLWVLRDNLKLTGTKFGCGAGMCGACTVLVDDVATRSCITPVGEVKGKKITTIEGVDKNHPVKKAWIEEDVPQCGYCQPGQIMQTISFLKKNPKPTLDEIKEAMAENACRCGTYPKIVNTIYKLSRG